MEHFAGLDLNKGNLNNNRNQGHHHQKHDVVDQGWTQAEGKGGPGPPWVQKFFFLVYKIFIKKAWAPWFLAWAPLTSPIPVPASQPRSFQEPMKTLKKKKYIYIYIYVCVCVKKKKEKRKKKEENLAVSKTPKPNRKARNEGKKEKNKRKERERRE